MAAAGALVFAGKSLSAPVIKEIVAKAFRYLGGYFSAESMGEMKKKLDRGMPKIQAVLDLVSPDRIKDESKALDAWFWQLRDAVEEAEDAMDELEYFELEEKAEERKVSDWGSSFAKMKHKVVRSVKRVSILDKAVKQFTHSGTLKRLKKAMEGLDKAAADITSILAVIECLKAAAFSNQRQEDLTNNCRETGSMLSVTKFVGREVEKERIIEWLTKASSVEEDQILASTNNIPILSIVGHGGMGKTTLVQSICKEDEVLQDFEKVIWATVSSSFDAMSVISKILESATGTTPSAKHLEALQKKLEQKLRSVKFLLVLDDAWEEDNINEWEKLFAPLRKGKSGSKILLTTRMASVADTAANVMGVERYCLVLEGLEESENLELFNHHLFSSLNSEDNGHLKLTGEQIAKKLGGCPLVTKVASGHLQGNMTFEYWNNFLHKSLKHFKGTKDDITGVLRLSYYYLPTELQTCFRYCSLFPDDYEFEKKELVQLWMGSGLISQATSDSLACEDMGEQFLAQLTRKSFFDLKSRGHEYDARKQEYYVMHDLMHELARNVSSGECARITDPARFEHEKCTVRHLYVACIHTFSVEEVKKISHFKNLRTIIIGDCGLDVDKVIVGTLEKVVESSKSLRLLHSRLINAFNDADVFSNLKHLRYIHLHQISPEGIRGVIKLYHLMLLCWHSGYSGLHRKTEHLRYVGNLERLRYVSYGVAGLRDFPISRLTSLQELNYYRVQPGSIGDKISAIGSLRDLRELQVQGIENVESHEEAINAKLNEKLYLNSLSLEWSSVSSGPQKTTDDLILDHLEPHGNVRELQILSYKGLKLPCWIENLAVKNLVSLKLESCINWGYLPSLGKLELLKHLSLVNLRNLQQIGQSSHMPSNSSMELLLPPILDTLEVRNCQELRELPMLPPSLVSLQINHSGLTTLPMIRQIVSGNTETKLPQLLVISVTECPCLTSLEGSLLEQKLYMGALRVLSLSDCIHMECAPIPFEEMNGLRELYINYCPKLRTMRDAKDKFLSSSLTVLTMGQCGDLRLPLLGSLQRLTNLSQLTLESSVLVSLPSADAFKSLKSLQYMSISGCKNLSSLGGLGALSSIFSLEIVNCSKLAQAGLSLTPDVSDGEEEPLVVAGSSLQIIWLQIDLPSLLLVEPLKSLCRTEILQIESEVEGLPERWLLQNRPSLQCLDLLEVSSLESLPPMIKDLSSLKGLEIVDAGQLQSLAHLPSSLEVLCIWRCHSELEKKSREYGGPEWNKISGINRVQIGDSRFIMGKECDHEIYHRLSSADDNTLCSWANQQKDVKRTKSGLHWWKKQWCFENAS